jgi:hypothetical protein
MTASAAVVGLVLFAAPLAASDPDPAGSPNFLAAAFAPGAVADLSAGLLFDQADDMVPQWGSGGRGMGKRAGLLLSGHLVETSVTYGVERWRGVSTDYGRCRCTRFGQRVRHAIVSEFVEQRADGGITAPVARFAGLYASEVAAHRLLPAGDGMAGLMASSGVHMGADMGMNILQEFWPEIRHTLEERLKRSKLTAFSVRLLPRP